MIRHEFDDAANAFGKMKEDLEDTADNIAEETADLFIRDSIQEMRANGSVETTTGIRSFRKKNLGPGKVGVSAASYLEALDRGTTPHTPDTSKSRFRIWARSNGFTVDQLANVIAQQGTKPHPWIENAKDRTRKRKNEAAKIKINKTLQKTERML